MDERVAGEASGAGVPADLLALMRGPDDGRGAVVEVHASAGGMEAGYWAQMLVRMYRRWAERHGLRSELLDVREGDEAGIEYAALEIGGPYAYGRLKGEDGVHRLVRIPPYDPAGRRHASFALVFVHPARDGEPVPARGDDAFDSQIRTYLFHPGRMVTDHRTNVQIEDVQAVMDGDVDPFIEAYLRAPGSV